MTIRSAPIRLAVSLIPSMTLPEVLRNLMELPNKSRACASHCPGPAFVCSSFEDSLGLLSPQSAYRL
jgi:hypothetical protein